VSDRQSDVSTKNSAFGDFQALFQLGDLPGELCLLGGFPIGIGSRCSGRRLFARLAVLLRQVL